MLGCISTYCGLRTWPHETSENPRWRIPLLGLSLIFMSPSDLNLKWAPTRIGKIISNIGAHTTGTEDEVLEFARVVEEKYANDKTKFFRTLPLRGHVGLPKDKLAMSLVLEDIPLRRNSSHNYYFCWWKLSFRCCLVGFGGRWDENKSCVCSWLLSSFWTVNFE